MFIEVRFRLKNQIWIKKMNETVGLKKKCDINIARTIDLARQMIRLARSADEQREDPGCGVLYGILLDSGYRILQLAEQEKRAHKKKGWWNQNLEKENR